MGLHSGLRSVEESGLHLLGRDLVTYLAHDLGQSVIQASSHPRAHTLQRQTGFILTRFDPSD